MIKQVRLLWELQNIEQQIKMLQKKKQQILSQEKSDLQQTILNLQQGISVGQKAIADLAHKCRQQENELAYSHEQRRELEKLLYGGSITQAKELEQIKVKYDSFQKENDQLEDLLISTMEKVEQLQQENEDQKMQLESIREEDRQFQSKLVKNIDELEIELEQLKTKQKDAKGLISDQLYTEYVKLGRQKNCAVAKVQNGVCGGCRVGIPIGQMTQDTKNIMYCDNCGRIIIIE